jgi:hypothetical protein
MFSSMSYKYKGNSIQDAFDVSISRNISQCSSDSNHIVSNGCGDLEPDPTMDGRSFYPITDDVLLPIDFVAWDRSMVMEESVFASQLKTTQQAFVLDGNSYAMNITDGETSGNSSVSTELFNNSVANDLEPHSVVFPNSGASPIPEDTSKWHPLSFEKSQLNSIDLRPFASLVSCHQSQNNQESSDDDLSMSAIISSHDRRFKPFHKEKWNQRYEDLVSFRRQTGHAAVPHTYPAHQQLARWIKR